MKRGKGGPGCVNDEVQDITDNLETTLTEAVIQARQPGVSGDQLSAKERE